MTTGMTVTRGDIANIMSVVGSWIEGQNVIDLGLGTVKTKKGTEKVGAAVRTSLGIYMF